MAQRTARHMIDTADLTAARQRVWRPVARGTDSGLLRTLTDHAVVAFARRHPQSGRHLTRAEPAACPQRRQLDGRDRRQRGCHHSRHRDAPPSRDPPPTA